ncbi:MAG: hypothetical protein ABFD25_03375 [Clostridiaceae bacterium]
MDYEKAWKRFRESNRTSIEKLKHKEPEIVGSIIDKNKVMMSILQANEDMFNDIEKECE